MKNIFVGNLSFGTTEQEVRALFEPFGAVDRASIATDRETGKSRGFAFVEMPNAAEGDRAIDALSGKEVGGRALTVNEARPKGEGGGRDRDRGGSRQSRWSLLGKRIACAMLSASWGGLGTAPGTLAGRRIKQRQHSLEGLCY